MLKPLQGDTMFVPNYEDYDRPSTNYGAAVFPQLWPEEMAGEGAIYRKSIEDRERWGRSLPSLETVIEHGKMSAPSKDDELTYKAWVTGVLAKLADENGWKVLHEFFFNGKRLNTIYRISSTPDAVTAHIKRRETPPPDEGINIDMKALEKHMRNLMPPSYRLKNSRHRFPTPTSQQELQEIVLAMLAEDNGWQVAVEDCSISNNKIYRIK